MEETKSFRESQRITELMNIEKYCFFRDYPDFLPMMNPNEMLQYGIHEGCIFHPQWGLKMEDLGLSMDQLNNLTKNVPGNITHSEPSMALNAFKALEGPLLIGAVVIPSHSMGQKLMDTRTFLEWYIRFYYKLEAYHELNRFMIDWRHEALDFAFNKAPKDANTDQLILHLAHNPGYPPTKKKDAKTRTI